MDPASLGISGLGALELLLAMKMSAVNGEQMKVMRTSSDPKKAGAAFLRSPYYRSWSRAQLNNAEYAPMLAVLILLIKYKADRAKRELGTTERLSIYGALGFSMIFVYAAASQGKLDVANMRPGQAGMSPLRPVGALGRYLSMAGLVYSAATA